MVLVAAKIAASDDSNTRQAAQAHQDPEDRQEKLCDRFAAANAEVCALRAALLDARLRQTTVLAPVPVALVALLALGVALAVGVPVAELVGVARS